MSAFGTFLYNPAKYVPLSESSKIETSLPPSSPIQDIVPLRVTSLLLLEFKPTTVAFTIFPFFFYFE